ncbi:integral membrane protein [Colletotrichum plurivorum]|uniref:Integral membrane protein n=1 Tax=Colletotrichum plurivorum TaxID=2175906 RepID=A0A8H6MQE6_9PEZI|nr:integral membrane protein [Colletotrichum plurivorum]
MYPYTKMAVLPEIEAYLIANSVIVFLTVVVVALRVVSRLLAGSKLGWDDFFTLLAMPQGIAMLVLQGLCKYSQAVCIVFRRDANILFRDILFLPFETIFGVVSLTTKLSVLFFYLRVFTSRPMRIATRATFVIVVLWGIGNVLQTMLVCHIKDGKWHATNPDICREHEASILSTGLFNCITNTVIMLVPLYTIWTLRKVSISTRWGLSAVFLLNFIAIIASVVRLVIMLDVHSLAQVMRNMALTTFLTVLETHLTILCNSLPMLLPLWAFWKHRRFETDEYVSRLGGNSQSCKHEHLVEDLTNGIPLETMYGKKMSHFTTTVGRGDARRGSANDQDEDDVSDTESTLRLPRNAQAITIETKWSITEETTK